MSLDEATNAEAASARPTRRRLAFPPGARVLIVDDVAENRLLLGLRCDQFGLNHECVESGLAAVEAARSGRFDVILMDIFMPRMDGMSATRAIRALPDPISAVPIIAVTTAAGPGESRRYLACGMNDVVPKPIDPARLAEALSAALTRRLGRRKARGAGAARQTA